MNKVGVLIIVLFLVSYQLNAVLPVKDIDRDLQVSNCHKLKNELGTNKTVPDDLKTAFYTALNYYPEFKNVTIIVKRKDIKTTMQCRPRLDYFLHSKKKRTYIIFVDDEKADNNGVLFDELPFNAQVGVFGHELAHVLDYNTKSSLSIVALGIKYLNSDSRENIEHQVDSLAIAKGLGYQINDFSKYVFEESNVSSEYLNYKKRFYFQPRQIAKIIAQTPLYFIEE